MTFLHSKITGACEFHNTWLFHWAQTKFPPNFGLTFLETFHLSQFSTNVIDSCQPVSQFIKNRIVNLFSKQTVQAILYRTDSSTKPSCNCLVQPIGHLDRGPSRDPDKGNCN